MPLASSTFLPVPTGTIGTTGLYGRLIQALSVPLEQDYVSDTGAGRVQYGDLTTAQTADLSWLRTDTALAYAALARGTAAARAGGAMHVLRQGAELVSTAATEGDLLVTGGASASAALSMTGATLMTFAACNTVSVTGNGNDVFSFGQSDRISVSGTGNTLYGGPGSGSFQVTGHSNTFRGGEGCSSLTLTGPDAAANVVIGGVGSLVVNSSAPVTQFIGGPGDTCMTLSGDYSSLLLGDGSFSGRLSGNGISVETGAGRAVLDITAPGGGTVVTGSGDSCVSFTGNGGIVLEGDPSGWASISMTGIGCTVCGGDAVTMTGSGMEVRSRAEGLAGNLGSRFTNVLGNMRSFAAADATVASAIEVADGWMNLDGTNDGTGGGTGGSCQPCCPSAPPVRYVSMNTTGSAVYANTRYDVVTVCGDNNNFYGGSAGRTVWIANGTGNAIWGSAGCNTYVGNGQQNVLEYIAPPTVGAGTAPGPVVVNLLRGYALNSYGGTDRIAGINWVEAGTGSSLTAGCADATLTILGDRGLIRDGAGDDTLTATGSRNTLRSESGNDLLHTGGQDNTYLLGSNCSVPGATEIRQDWQGVTGTLQFMNPSASPRQLWFNRDAAGDLLIHVLGTREVVTVDGWFSQGTQLRSITAGGQAIDNAGINAMEAAMSGYQSSHAGFDPGTACFVPQDRGLAGAFSAWHAA